MSIASQKRSRIPRIGSTRNPMIREFLKSEPNDNNPDDRAPRPGFIQDAAHGVAKKVMSAGELVAMVFIATNPVSVALGLALVRLMTVASISGRFDDSHWEISPDGNLYSTLHSAERAPNEFKMETDFLVASGKIDEKALNVVIKVGEHQGKSLRELSECELQRFYDSVTDLDSQNIINSYRAFCTAM